MLARHRIANSSVVRPFRYIKTGREFKSYLEIELFSQVSVHAIIIIKYTFFEVNVIQGLLLGRKSYKSS